MCYSVIVNSGEKIIETPREFQEHFGFMPLKDKNYKSIEMDCCLCQCDVEETFRQRNIPFKFDWGDYYVDEKSN